MFIYADTCFQICFENKNTVSISPTEEPNKVKLAINHQSVGHLSPTQVVEYLESMHNQDDHNDKIIPKDFVAGHQELPKNKSFIFGKQYFTIVLPQCVITIKHIPLTNHAALTISIPNHGITLYKVTPETLVQCLKMINNKPEINYLKRNSIEQNNPDQLYTILIANTYGFVLRTEGPTTLEEAIRSVIKRLELTDDYQIDNTVVELVYQAYIVGSKDGKKYKIAPHYPLPN